ncbi:MAG TPA: SCO family protein [Chthoniobacterales bacterium]
MKILLLAILVAAISQPTATEFQQRVGFDQKLGDPLPLNQGFYDETGRVVRLGEFFHGKPVIVVPAYYGCPNLCTLVLNGLLLSARDLRKSAGTDYDIIVVSIDPRETASIAHEKQQSYVRRYGRAGASAGWHLLTGGRDSISAFTRSIGFRYFYDQSSDQFAHPSGIVVVTPDGKISQYLLGIDYPPKGLDAALEKASENRVGSVVRNLLLLCFHYDPATGKYSLAIARVLQFAGVLTVVGLAVFVWSMERRRRRPGMPP